MPKDSFIVYIQTQLFGILIKKFVVIVQVNQGGEAGI